MSDRKRNYQNGWKGEPDVQPGHADRCAKNKAVKDSPQFQKACTVSGVEATTRQARKFRGKCGMAYRAKGFDNAEAFQTSLRK